MDIKQPKPKPQTYWDVKIETLLPTTLVYRVRAASAEEAAEMVKKIPPNQVKYRLAGKKDLKLTVYDAGCSVIKFFKNLVR